MKGRLKAGAGLQASTVSRSNVESRGGRPRRWRETNSSGANLASHLLRSITTERLALARAERLTCRLRGACCFTWNTPSIAATGQPAMDHHALWSRVRRAGVPANILLSVARNGNAAGSASSCPSGFHVKPAEGVTSMPRPRARELARPCADDGEWPVGPAREAANTAARPAGAGLRRE